MIQAELTDDPSDKCTTNASELKAIASNVIANGNTHSLAIGVGMGAINGVVASALDNLISSWESATTDSTTGDRKVMRATLPVAKCIDNNCIPLVGAVEVDILWIIQQKITNKKEAAKAPYTYRDADNPDGTPGSVIFTSSNTDDDQRMADFLTALNLNTQDDKGHEVNKRTFFRPTCKPAIPTGGPGGENFGVLASRAVLVN